MISMAKPHQSPIEAVGVMKILCAIELHHMLLFTHEQFHMNFIQVYLQGGQSILQDGSHQLMVCNSIRPVHVAQTGFFSS